MAGLALKFFLITIVILASFLAAYALFLIKKVSASLNLFPLSVKIFNLKLFFALGIYVLGIVVCMIAMKYLDYTLVIPLTSFAYIFSMFLSYKFLGEKVSEINIIGVFIICIASVILVI
jgi:drug/metabolite transporter (DMT)-like permease